jgi:predicted acyltransferase
MRETVPLLGVTPRRRFRSLDFLRGMTVLLMLVVNAQALPWTFDALAHPTWFGLAPLADAIFPVISYRIDAILYR